MVHLFGLICALTNRLLLIMQINWKFKQLGCYASRSLHLARHVLLQVPMGLCMLKFVVDNNSSWPEETLSCAYNDIED